VSESPPDFVQISAVNFLEAAAREVAGIRIADAKWSMLMAGVDPDPANAEGMVGPSFTLALWSDQGCESAVGQVGQGSGRAAAKAQLPAHLPIVRAFVHNRTDWVFRSIYDYLRMLYR